MTEQEVLFNSLMQRFRIHQPLLFAGLPEETEFSVGIIPHLNLPFPVLAFQNVIYCPWIPLNSKLGATP